MESSMENTFVQANDKSIDPKPAKKPKLELLEDEPLICKVCLLEFKVKADVIEHLISSHVRCNFCPKNFGTIVALKEHYSDDHFTKRPFKCDKMNQPTKKLRLDIDSALLEAISKNNLEYALFLIENGANINPQTDDFNFLKSPLFLAIYSGYEQIVETLLSKGAKMDLEDSNGDFPLHFAVRQKKKESICVLVDHGADIDARNTRKQMSPLEIAILVGNEEIVETLLSKGAKMDMEDSNGDYPLHFAVSHKKKELICVLADHGADIDARNTKDQRTPLEIAIIEGNDEIVITLLSKGAKINFQDSSCNPVVHKAVRYITGETDVEDSCGETPLYKAVESNRKTIVELLLKNGANIEARNGCFKETALIKAVKKENEDIVGMLIENGANTEARINYINYTPLHLAAEKNLLSIVKILLKNGANIEDEDDKSQTPIYKAIHENNVEIVKIFVTNGAKIDHLDFRDITPIHFATLYNKQSILDILLNMNPDLNLPCFVELLHCAIYKGNLEIAEKLINYGVDVNSKDSDGTLSIHTAIEENKLASVEATKWLLRKGASLLIRNQEGNNPLECALNKEENKLSLIKTITYHQHSN